MVHHNSDKEVYIMKRNYILFSMCLVLLVSGCSVKETKEYTQAERELQVYNTRVETIFDNYTSCETAATTIEGDLKEFFVTGVFTEGLKNFSNIFTDMNSFMLFMLDYGSYNDYCLNLADSDKQVFADYIEGFSIQNCETAYYMNSNNGSLVQFFTYVGEDTRVMEVRVDWDEGDIKSIKVLVKGEKVSEEDFFRPQ